jgi:putative Holliday junction resolvase
VERQDILRKGAIDKNFLLGYNGNNLMERGAAIMTDHENEHEHEEEENIVVLTDDEGNDHEFTVIDILEVEGNEYAILLPLTEDDDDEEEEAIILKIEQDEEGEEVLVSIEDDDEWDKVAKAWEEMLVDEDLDG